MRKWCATQNAVSMDANASVIAQYVEQIARGSESTQLYALDQLRALSSGATRNKNAIREYGAIPHIVAALKKPPQSSMVPASALSLLRSLSVNERNQVAIADAGAIPLLFQCLQSPKEAVQANAAAVLWNLASDSENKATIGDTGGVQMLLRLLQRARSVRVQTEVCGALRNLSYRYENLEYFARQEGGVATMTDVLMLRGNESSEVRKNVAVTLNMCMQHPRTRREIERANCMPTLLRTLREFSIELTPETAQELALLENGAPSALLPQPPLVPHQELQWRRGSMQSPALPVESLALSPALRTLDVFGSIAWSGLELETIIGKGSFSEVYRARYNGFVVAAKLLTERMPEDKRKREQLLQEHRMLAALKHPNVILLMGTSLSPDAKPVFVFELCARGALKDVLPNERSMLRRLKFGKDIVAGLNWLHAHNIVHRDLKCANILVDEEYKAKISDLGLALLYYDGVVCEHFKGTFFFWFFSFFLFVHLQTDCVRCVLRCRRQYQV